MVTKIIWTRSDNFQTMREKLIAHVGEKVIGAGNEKGKEVTIFSVSEIEQVELPDYLSNFVEFMDGNKEYALKDGGFNFKTSKSTPMWAYTVCYGQEYGENIISRDYTFMLPRKVDYLQDVKDCQIFMDREHPFIYYDLK